MKSILSLHKLPSGSSLLADELIEFHSARLLLLLGLCGKRHRIDGLTKLAKLDFFVRYPDFFEKACAFTGDNLKSALSSTESSMVRHHYGPWDHRYYEVLAYLRSRKLIQITEERKITYGKENKIYKFELTELGKKKFKSLKEENSFSDLCEQMKRVKKKFGSKNGSSLKKMIYEIFQEEVSQRSLGEIIG